MEEAHVKELLSSERQRLETIEADIERGGLITDTDSQTIEEQAGGQHPGDVATAVEDRSRDIGLLEQVERELREIEDALRRLEDGTYGLCLACGEPIPDERLEANPTARFDVAHDPGEHPGLAHNPGDAPAT